MIPQNYIRHKVRPDDTLTSLAERIDLSENDLKEFHNQHCGKMNKLWVTNLKGIDLILIPTRFVSAEALDIQQHKMLPPVHYFLHFHANKYLAEETIEHSDDRILKFSYTIGLNVQQNNESFVAEIDLSNYKKNEQIPEDKISSLSLECMKSLSPVSFKIASNGRIESCFQHQNTVEKFKAKRKDIEDFFTGEISTKYLDAFEENLTDENDFFRQIQSGLLHQILFPDLSSFRQKTAWKEKLIINNNAFPLEFTCTTAHRFDHASYVETFLSGDLSENCSLRELLRGIRIENEPVTADVQVEIIIHYFTDTVTHQLMKAKTSIHIQFQNELFQKHTLHLTQYQDENVRNPIQ